MGYGAKDEENPVSEEENEEEAEKKKLKPPQEEEMEMTKIPVKTRDATYPEVIAGHSDPLIKSHHLKYLLLGFNCFLTVLGLALLSISIWIRADPEFWQYQTTLNVDNLHAVCIMFIVASLCIVIIGFLGCCAAATERRWLLIVYILIFGVVFLIQLTAVILMWIAPYSKTISKKLEEQIQHQINNRNKDDSSRFFVDFIQDNLECCGAKDIKDYMGEAAPSSCQSKITGSIQDTGCATKMLSYLRGKAGILGGFALPILLVQLLAILAAGCLVKSLDVESRYFM